MSDDLNAALSDLAKAEAEIEMLRAALDLIAAMDDESDEWDGRDRFRVARTVAREATDYQGSMDTKR